MKNLIKKVYKKLTQGLVKQADWQDDGKKYTIFLDVDGSIFRYRKFETYKTSEPELLPGVWEKLNQWTHEGHLIILTTARPEDLREHTIYELSKFNLPWGRLIMGIERGPRFLINDMDPGKTTTLGVRPKYVESRATGINLVRNEGFAGINWGLHKL